MMPNTITWVVERSAFSPAYSEFCATIERLGHRCQEWDDEWWHGSELPELQGPVLFHGSLGNADRIVRELQWTPGAFCRSQAFYCSQWYEQARQWLVHDRWRTSTVAELADSPREVAGDLATKGQVFVRPDSPLKPFSGRVCAVEDITLAALDFGFYYEDESTPVVVAPVQSIGREWRFVVVNREVIAGSGYLADGRTAVANLDAGPRQFAAQVAKEFEAPEAVYILDICEVDGDLRLVEINPFSGADLYACDPEAVVGAVSSAI